jgi:hypothetical protein
VDKAAKNRGKENRDNLDGYPGIDSLYRLLLGSSGAESTDAIGRLGPGQFFVEELESI